MYDLFDDYDYRQGIEDATDYASRAFYALDDAVGSLDDLPELREYQDRLEAARDMVEAIRADMREARRA